MKLSCKSSVLAGSYLAPSDWGWDPDYDMAAHLADLRLQESHEKKSTKYDMVTRPLLVLATRASNVTEEYKIHTLN